MTVKQLKEEAYAKGGVGYWVAYAQKTELVAYLDAIDGGMDATQANALVGKVVNERRQLVRDNVTPDGSAADVTGPQSGPGSSGGAGGGDDADSDRGQGDTDGDGDGDSNGDGDGDGSDAGDDSEPGDGDGDGDSNGDGEPEPQLPDASNPPQPFPSVPPNPGGKDPFTELTEYGPLGELIVRAIIFACNHTANAVYAWVTMLFDGLTAVIQHQEQKTIAACDRITKHAEAIAGSASKAIQQARDSVDAPVAQMQATIVLPTRPDVNVKGPFHAEFAEILKTAAVKREIFFWGPAGTGKTTLARQIAEAMGLEFSFISCTAGMSESHITGIKFPAMTDRGYVNFPADALKRFEEGGVLLADEICASDANVTMIWQAALDQGVMPVPWRTEKPYAIRHPDFVFIGADNTTGRSATGGLQFAARNQQDAAFLNRFKGAEFHIGLDKSVERSIAMGLIKANLTDPEKQRRVKAELAGMIKAFNRIRKNIENSDLDVQWGMREAKTFALLRSTYPDDPSFSPAAMMKRFTITLNETEREKVLEGVTIPGDSATADTATDDPGPQGVRY